MEKTSEIQIIESEAPVYEQAQRASIDMQIATAKRFPRDIVKFRENTKATVTINDETAATCGYSLPRGGKQIQGPSVHLARILAQFYGNLRVESRGTMISDKYITAEAVAFDLESNLALKVEARRKIIGSTGKRYSDDVINTNMLAIQSIAERNAILRIIPRSFVDEAYKAAQRKLTGDLSTADKLSAARKKVVDYFAEEYDVKEEEILKLFGKTALTQITSENIASLRGLVQALKDGDTTVDDAFNRDKENADGEKAKQKAEDFENEKVKEKPSMPPEEKTTSPDDGFAMRRDNIINRISKKYNVSQAHVLNVIDKNSINEIGKNEMIELIELEQSLKDKVIDPDKVFGKKPEEKPKGELPLNSEFENQKE